MFICNFDHVENRKIVSVTSVNCNHECFVIQHHHEEMRRQGSYMFINSALVTKRYKNLILKSVFSVV